MSTQALNEAIFALKLRREQCLYHFFINKEIERVVPNAHRVYVEVEHMKTNFAFLLRNAIEFLKDLPTGNHHENKFANKQHDANLHYYAEYMEFGILTDPNKKEVYTYGKCSNFGNEIVFANTRDVMKLPENPNTYTDYSGFTTKTYGDKVEIQMIKKIDGVLFDSVLRTYTIYLEEFEYFFNEIKKYDLKMFHRDEWWHY